ncbi:hypothetical protein QUF74_05580 [Candidatus Halobeggiatoa sp. HSG11]|nr:hypothetical protein [Candidatus Halobeggiatoa sp. HSG11]
MEKIAAKQIVDELLNEHPEIAGEIVKKYYGKEPMVTRSIKFPKAMLDQINVFVHSKTNFSKVVKEAIELGLPQMKRAK